MFMVRFPFERMRLLDFEWRMTELIVRDSRGTRVPEF